MANTNKNRQTNSQTKIHIQDETEIQSEQTQAHQISPPNRPWWKEKASQDDVAGSTETATTNVMSMRCHIESNDCSKSH